LRIGLVYRRNWKTSHEHYAPPREIADLCLIDVVLVYGIASSVSGDVDDFHSTAAEAEATLDEILADEPELKGALWAEPVELEIAAN
jgi:hypothetical protein